MDTLGIMAWAKDDMQRANTYQLVEDFFNDLIERSVKGAKDAKLTYRGSQETFACSVMEAIKDRDILLIEAGVGTGKSIGYLIPLFYSLNNVTSFKKVIISTSSIALEEQLMKDIDLVSNLLGIKIEPILLKGMNNYACLKRIDEKISIVMDRKDSNLLKKLNSVKKMILKGGVSDKAELPAVDMTLWKDIQAMGGCERCKSSKHCPYYLMQSQIDSKNIIVTNHTYLNNLVKNKKELVESADAIIIDEAHKLEEQFRLSEESVINLNDINRKLDILDSKINADEEHSLMEDKTEFHVLKKSLKESIFELAKTLRSNVRGLYNKQSSEYIKIEDCGKLKFNVNSIRVQNALQEVIKQFKLFNRFMKERNLIKYYRFDVEYLNRFLTTLNDMQKGINSDNIYWLNFVTEEKIQIEYTPKDISQSADKLYAKDKTVVYTSATLTTDRNYDYFKNGINLPKKPVEENPLASPFDFDENTLVYYAPDLPHPKFAEHTLYLSALADRVEMLINITEGKALVLFMSKFDMNAVYNILKTRNIPYHLILQDNNVKNCINEFSGDTNSCLFATGAFWEGIDLKGKTLSNLIIARLPFPVQDPIVEYKKSEVTDKKQNIELDDMLLKLKQGTGRLIRSVSDTGIVCILDSRSKELLPSIKSTLPFTNYTTSLEEITKFSKEKILEETESIDVFKLD